jgi:SAM-dependent methyltransferase
MAKKTSRPRKSAERSSLPKPVSGKSKAGPGVSPAAMRRSSAAFERTLNNMGFMISTLDEISESFAQFAGESSELPVLDIGAAFGVATIAALSRGAKVIANDIDPRHLTELVRRTPASLKPRLQTRSGAFPDGFDLPDGSVRGVLLSRVMHFFDGPQVEKAVRTLKRWLTPGGKAFVVVEASLFLDFPQLKAVYEERRARKARWPGFVTGVHKLIPARAGFLPDQIHYLDRQVLSRAFRDEGFVIEQVGLFQRSEDPADPDARIRESVGLIARRD